ANCKTHPSNRKVRHRICVDTLGKEVDAALCEGDARDIEQCCNRGEFPWVISLTDEKIKHFCGGIILSNLWILTTAQCICAWSQSSCCSEQYQLNPENCPPMKNWRVAAGQLKLNSRKSQIRNIIEVFIHEDNKEATKIQWNESQPDIALVKLDRPLQLNPDIQPVTGILPTSLCTGKSNAECQTYIKNYTLPKFCELAGWGAFRKDGILKGKLKWSKVLVTASDENSITTNMPSSRIWNPCEGDQGAPLMCKPEGSNSSAVVVGILSFVEYDCSKFTNRDTFHTPVYKHLNWIFKHINKDEETKDFSSVISISKNNRHICGGVIISDVWILTAAICICDGNDNCCTK
ncbi:unnamed protein product, partial [Owenia fusiformis]